MTSGIFSGTLSKEDLLMVSRTGVHISFNLGRCSSKDGRVISLCPGNWFSSDISGDWARHPRGSCKICMGGEILITLEESSHTSVKVVGLAVDIAYILNVMYVAITWFLGIGETRDSQKSALCG